MVVFDMSSFVAKPNVNGVRKALGLCGVLTDAVWVAERTLRAQLVFALVSPLLLTVGHGVLTGAAVQSNVVMFLLGMAMVAVVFSWPSMTAVRLILRESNVQQDTALFLRAFRSDASSDALRAWLKAALGSSIRLSGIRQPRQRASGLVNFLSPLITGLRYAGSTQFELVARDHNWMARLLATFGEARFVFIDIRDVTPYVLDEIRLAWRVFGRERIIFIIDARQTRRFWVDWILSQFGERVEPPAPVRKGRGKPQQVVVPDPGEGLQLLEWPTLGRPQAGPFVAQMQRWLEMMPAGVVTVDEGAVQEVERKVSAANWPTQLSEKPWFIIAASVVGLGLLMQVVVLMVPESQPWLVGAVALYLQISFWMAWNRARKQRRLALQINPAGAMPGSRPRQAGLLMGGTLLFMGVGMTFAMATFSAIQEQAMRMKTVMHARMVAMSLLNYASDHNAQFPDRAESRPMTANEALRELFREGITRDERMFGAPNSVHRPDERVGAFPDFDEALRPGENNWALVAGRTSVDQPSHALLLEDPAEAAWPPQWDTDLKGKPKPGRAWRNRKVVIARVDGSAEEKSLQDGKGLQYVADPLLFPAKEPRKVLDVE